MATPDQFVPSMQALRTKIAARPDLPTVNQLFTSLSESPGYLALPVPAIINALAALEAQVRGVAAP